MTIPRLVFVCYRSIKALFIGGRDGRINENKQPEGHIGAQGKADKAREVAHRV